MKIEKLRREAVADSTTSGPLSLTETELRGVSAGVEPFSCAYFDWGNMTIAYHNGYPRPV